jgi:hypothetical protein
MKAMKAMTLELRRLPAEIEALFREARRPRPHITRRPWPFRPEVPAPVVRPLAAGR